MDTIQQFHVDIDPAIVEEFQSRLNNSRWFDSIEGSAEWSYGTSGKYLKEVCEYVSSGEFNFNQANAGNPNNILSSAYKPNFSPFGAMQGGNTGSSLGDIYFNSGLNIGPNKKY